MSGRGGVKVAGAQIYRTSLDKVEPGTEEFFESQMALKGRSKLPDGVQSKSLYKDILHIAWPALAEFSLAQLTSMVGMMMVGGLGAWALSAVSLATQPKFILMMMFMSMNVGATAMVARCRGAGEQEKANHVVRQAVVITLAFSIVSAILGYVFAEPLVRLMGDADAQSLRGGVDYLRIQMYGLIPLALTSTFTAVLRGVGNTRAAMIYNIISNIVNVIFNFLLVEGKFGFPRLEVNGSSIATVIGQSVAFIIALITVMRPGQYIRLKLRESFKPDPLVMGQIAKIGLPAMFESVVMRIGVIVYTRTVVGLGTVPFATHNVCMNIQAMSFMTGQAFATSATTLMGQSLGKRRPDMGMVYGDRARKLGHIVSAVMMIAFFFFGKYIVALYNDDSEIVDMGGRILKLVAFMQPFQNSQFIISGALRGAGDTRSIAYIISITTLIIRPALAIVAIDVFNFGLYGAWFAIIVDQLLRSLLVLLRYNSGKWRRIKIRI